MTEINSNKNGNHLFLFLVFLVAVRFLTMGLYPLTDSSEARYAEVARKMVELNDWITPWYEYGVPFWAKPPLSTWLTAASMKLFGINEFAARLPQFILAIGIARMVWNVAKKQSRRQAVLAIAILSGTLLYVVAAAAVLTDMSMTLATTMVMTAFWEISQKNSADHNKHQWKLFIGLGIGMLAKGPVAIVLSTMPIFIWAVITGNFVTTVKKIQWLKGTLIFLAISLPWYMAAEIRTPGFIRYFFYGEHWQRFTVTGWTGDRYGSAHAEPHGYIWLLGIAAYFPWTIVLPLALIGRKTSTVSAIRATQRHESVSDQSARIAKKEGKRHMTSGTEDRYSDNPPAKMSSTYLLIWLLSPFVFFTFAGNVLWTYVLPGVPALALIFAPWLDRDIRQSGIDMLMMIVLLIMALTITGFLYKQEFNHSWKTAKFVVQEYDKRNVDGLPLIFVGDRPYSGSFYSGGKVLHVENFEDLNKKLINKKSYVALTPEQSLRIPEFIGSKLVTQIHVDAYDLYRSAN